MKILHTADWHIGQFKGPVENGVNLRGLDTVKCLEYMVDVARQEFPDIVCVSGDIFHQEQIGPSRYSDEMVTATRIIEELSKVSKLVVVMRGTSNHDGTGQFKVLEKMFEKNPKVEIVTTPKVVSTSIADIACIPGFDKQEFRAKFPGLSSEEENIQWTQYISDIVTGLRAQCGNTNIIKDAVPAILMAHYTVPGCNMESGQTSFFANFEPVIPRETLQVANYEAVLLGHIHRPQTIDGLHNVFYSGAINSMNFNDEGQNRGFWIHEFESGRLVKEHRYSTPYREFRTVTMTQEEIRDYLSMRQAYLCEKLKEDDIRNCIVRVKYSCDSEQKKMLNIPALQADLYACGAFYVADIEAESMVDVTNRGLLSEESDPLLNLKKWLDEKCFKDTDKIVELAEPIIASAMQHSSTADIHGVFKPIFIDVKNYRNYPKEHFDFEDISFCTINGQNGAGKSSLFMDAIVDCLFEDTREGDSKSWIRATEDARSGAIEFVFDIGNTRFRVVRTRTKSGKPTLNLAQLSQDGEWLNLSKERIIDTQAEIIRILGMDAMTFKSCALIMQDQYGLFLQAKKDERISILSNLLGLGVYGVMEADTRKRLADAKRDLAAKKEAVNIKNEFISSKGNPEEELNDANNLISEKNKILESLNDKRKSLASDQALYESRLEETRRLRKESEGLETKKKQLEKDIEDTNKVIFACDTMLEHADTIKEKAGRFNEISELMNGMAKDVALWDSEKLKLQDLKEQSLRYQNIIDNCKLRNEQIVAELQKLQSGDMSVIEEKLKELEFVKTELEELEKKKLEKIQAENEYLDQKAEIDKRIQAIKVNLTVARADLAAYEQQKELMDNSECPMVSNATCKFLRKAIREAGKIADTKAGIKIYETAISEAETELDDLRRAVVSRIDKIGCNFERVVELKDKKAELVKYVVLKQQAEEDKLQIARLEVEKESNDKTIAQSKENSSQLILRAQETTERVDKLSKSVETYRKLKEERDGLSDYVERVSKLPVYEERKKNAEEKLGNFQKEVEIVEEKLFILMADIINADEKLKQSNSDSVEQLQKIDAEIDGATDTIARLQITKGALQQKVEDVKKMRDEVKELSKGIEVAAGLAAKYEILKQAFSQDGVPHQIIRNIIPHIADVANNILGSMTGGTMGVEFVMDKAVKGKDGDKATLDVLINEFGKTTLPYASKSGGEKVKASLAVILALAEIKTTAAGIQLGMLFIDEPPFLDNDGAQAYVDSLETIRSRYPDVKVMAITHDDAMKARFSQSITVIKTDEGSKVIC